MNNYKFSIDLTALQGARIVEKDGTKHLVINLSKARAKAHQNGKVYLNLEAIESKQPGKFGDTHFVKETTSKEERESGIKLPIVGNAKPFGNKPQQQNNWDDQAPRQRNYTAKDAIQPDNGDEIPW
jgi:hypothetical protein